MRPIVDTTLSIDTLHFSFLFKLDLLLATDSCGKTQADMASKSDFRLSSVSTLAIAAKSFGSNDSMLWINFLVRARSLGN